MSSCEQHRLLSDTTFLSAFQTGELDPVLFSHEAHLRLAWLYVRIYGLEDAICRITEALFSYVTKVGASDKFDLPLTVTAVKIVNDFVLKSSSKNFFEFIAAYPDLMLNFKGLVERYHQNNLTE